MLFVGDSDMSIFYYIGFRIEIQPHDEGWDYTIYERDGREWDGGIYDDMEAKWLRKSMEIVHGWVAKI